MAARPHLLRRTIGVVAFVMACGLSSPSAAAKPGDNSVAMLYLENEVGSLSFNCTAFAIGTFQDNKTAWLTAGHCIGRDGAPTYHLVMLSLDGRTFYRANIVGVGNPYAGRDWGLLSSDLRADHLELGDETRERDGAEVFEIGAPAGLGIFRFDGRVVQVLATRPIVSEELRVDWTHCIVLDIKSVKGMSGSPVMSKASGRVIGINVGYYQDALTIAQPISTFLEVQASAPKEVLVKP
jgi:hypothetical protein